MNTEETNLFQLASKRLQWLSTRQKVVAENIANADVAGFRAQDVENFEEYLKKANGAQSLQAPQVLDARVSWGEDLTGNNVVMEEQLMEANNAASQFKVAANLYRKAHDMLYAVAGRK